MSTMLGLMGCGVVAGLTSSFLSNPLDVIKTRYQISKHAPKGVLTLFHETARLEGWSVFLRGVKPRMWNATIMSSIAVLTYEQTKLWSRISVT